VICPRISDYHPSKVSCLFLRCMPSNGHSDPHKTYVCVTGCNCAPLLCCSPMKLFRIHIVCRLGGPKNTRRTSSNEYQPHRSDELDGLSMITS